MPQRSTAAIDHEAQTAPPRPLWKEITVVLLVKLAVLAGIWYLFFSEPVGEHISGTDVSEHILY
ncbi:MAG: hypothetical protein D6786_06000 [Gammaproteobacteria bacterium]|nr:MAG: hypothetical protein D6786_06000 [Gammaproteobacteria bacterium]